MGLQSTESRGDMPLDSMVGIALTLVSSNISILDETCYEVCCEKGCGVLSLFFPPTVKELVEHPYETKSDSFYFVEGRLVMHNKAEYAYNADNQPTD